MVTVLRWPCPPIPHADPRNRHLGCVQCVQLKTTKTLESPHRTQKTSLRCTPNCFCANLKHRNYNKASLLGSCRILCVSPKENPKGSSNVDYMHGSLHCHQRWEVQTTFQVRLKPSALGIAACNHPSVTWLLGSSCGPLHERSRSLEASKGRDPKTRSSRSLVGMPTVGEIVL